MLPVYTNSSDTVHYRHGNPPLPTSRPSTGSPPPVRHATGPHKAARVLLQLLALTALLAIIWCMAVVSPRLSGKRPAGTRRMLDGAAASKALALPLPAAALRNLVLVAGHAVYVGNDYALAANESVWFLEEYQKVPGEAQSFLDHIELGVATAAKDPAALLLFSGGQTRRAAGPRSEGLSYWVVAEAAGWFGQRDGVRNRTFTEEHARDSFENLLFGLCRFYELTGHYPDRVTVVSYNLKRSRFNTLHREALRFPASHFAFLGTEIPPAAKGAKEGEQRTVAAFRQDPYGCTGDLLQKKLQRDPFAVGPPHPSRCPALTGLLTHCRPTLFEGALPWGQAVSHDDTH